MNNTITTKDIIYELAKGVSEKKSGISYGRLRTKLEKQGFSEISLFSAVARHCEENSIPPSKYIKDTCILLEGCARDLFFPKTHNDFSYLRGQFHDLRQGNLEKDEPKSPEQRGLFLCNTCFNIKDGKDRASGASTKYTCKPCKVEKSKAASSASYQRKKALKEENASEPLESSTAISQIDTKAPEPIETKKEQPMNQESKKSFAHIIAGQIPQEDKEKIKLSEVIADENGATITVNCPTSSLHLVLSAVSQVTE